MMIGSRFKRSNWHKVDGRVEKKVVLAESVSSIRGPKNSTPFHTRYEKSDSEEKGRRKKLSHAQVSDLSTTECSSQDQLNTS